MLNEIFKRAKNIYKTDYKAHNIVCMIFGSLLLIAFIAISIAIAEQKGNEEGLFL